MMKTAGQTTMVRRILRYSAAPLFLLFVEYVGGFSGIAAIFLGFLFGLYYAIRMLIAIKNRPKCNVFGRKMLCLIATCILCVMLAGWNSQPMEVRAQQIIGALDSYKTQHGAYPEDLKALVPEFLPKIPKARRLGGSSYTEFLYFVQNDTHKLAYIVAPPNALRIYSMETGQWSAMD